MKLRELQEASDNSYESMIAGVLKRGLKGVTRVSVGAPYKSTLNDWEGKEMPLAFAVKVFYKPFRGSPQQEIFTIFKSDEGEWGFTTDANNEWEIGPTFEEAMDGAMNAIKIARKFHVKDQE